MSLFEDFASIAFDPGLYHPWNWKPVQVQVRPTPPSLNVVGDIEHDIAQRTRRHVHRRCEQWTLRPSPGETELRQTDERMPCARSVPAGVNAAVKEAILAEEVAPKSAFTVSALRRMLYSSTWLR